MSYIEQTWKQHSITQLVDAYLPSLKLTKLEEKDMQVTVGLVRMNLYATFSNVHIYTDEQVFDDQLQLIYNSSVQTQDGV